MKKKITKTIFGALLVLGITFCVVILVKLVDRMNDKYREKFIDQCLKDGGALIYNSDGTLGCYESRPEGASRLKRGK